MAGKLKANESPIKGVRRLARGQVSKALEELKRDQQQGQPLSNEVIHSIRKRLKRTRALLRLARSALGSTAYHRENEAYRDAARPLTAVRDAEVLIQTLDQLVRQPGRDPQPLESIRSTLVRQHEEARRQVFEFERAQEPICQALEQGLARMDRWRTRAGGWKVLASGLKRIYRNARHACQAAAKAPTSERLHEWRKQAKYLRYQLETLQPMWPIVMDDLVEKMKGLGDLLGEDHDLAVLRARLDNERVFPDRSLAGDLQQAIDRRREELQQQARDLGEPFFQPRPKALVAHLEECWHLWRAKPKAMAEA